MGGELSGCIPPKQLLMSISTLGSYAFSSTNNRLAIILELRIRTLSQLPCLIALRRRRHRRCHFRITTSWGVQQCNFLPSTWNLFSVMTSSDDLRQARKSNHFIIRNWRLPSCTPDGILLNCSRHSISLSIWTLGIVSMTLSQNLFTWSWFL